jgi:orotidine-5'-phosphate decarboxylase
MNNFSDRCEEVVKKKKSCLLLGLDPSLEKMPAHLPKTPEGIFRFCFEIINATEKMIAGVKIQMAYFEIFGAEGVAIVERLLEICRQKKLLTIVDAKRNDIGSTAEAYAQAYLGDGKLSCDALTVNPLLGSDSVLPFVKKCEKNGRGVFILVRTSNPSADEFQAGEQELSLRIAEKIGEWDLSTQSEKNFFSAIGAVIGATLNPELIKFFREELPQTWFLCPGVGAQGGNLESVLAVRKNGIGVLVPLSRSILYAGNGKDFAQKSAEAMMEVYEEQQKF